MNKIISLFLAAVLLLTCSVAVSAANVTSNSSTDVNVSHTVGSAITGDGASQDMQVSHVIGEGYIVNIPESLVLTMGEERTVDVALTDVVMDRSKTIAVSISGRNYSNGWKLTAKGGYYLEYSIKNEGIDVLNNQIVLTCTGGSSMAGSKLVLLLPTAEVKSVSYTDTLTFTVSVNG